MAQPAILKTDTRSRTRKQSEEISTLIEQLNLAGERISLRLENINRQMEEIVAEIRAGRRDSTGETR